MLLASRQWDKDAYLNSVTMDRYPALKVIAHIDGNLSGFYLEIIIFGGLVEGGGGTLLNMMRLKAGPRGWVQEGDAPIDTQPCPQAPPRSSMLHAENRRAWYPISHD